MKKLADWIIHHQIAAFFMITFAITWGLGFSYAAIINEEQVLLAPLAFVATCGPALAGIIISTISNTQPRQGSRRAFWIAFGVAWIVSAGVFLANNRYFNYAPPNPVMVGFTLVAVVPVAFVISMAYSRIPAVKSYLSSLVRLRGVWGWTLLALALPLALILLSMLVERMLGGQPGPPALYPNAGLPLIGMVVLKFLYQFFFFNATGEEAGWRGFALPRLQARASPLIGGLILAFFWPLWHFFLWQAEGAPVLTAQFWINKYLLLVPATLLLGWFYNRSKGSILVAGTFHAAGNTAFIFFPNLDGLVYTVVNAIFVLVLILADRMWHKLPADHQAVYQSA